MIVAADVSTLVGRDATVSGLIYGLPIGTKVRIISLHKPSEQGWYIWVSRTDDLQPAPTMYLAPLVSLTVEPCPGR